MNTNNICFRGEIRKKSRYALFSGAMSFVSQQLRYSRVAIVKGNIGITKIRLFKYIENFTSKN